MTDKQRVLTAAQARRTAIAAQGFSDPPPTGRVTAAHLKRVYDRVGVLQIDSVNVLSRSHYLPVFARLGAYDRTALDALVDPKRAVFEYWAHMAAFVPVDLFPLLHHRMAAYRAAPTWHRIDQITASRPGAVEDALAFVAAHGPLRAVDLSPERINRRAGEMWGWHDGKVLIEYLFLSGLVSVVRRTPAFERVYDLTERVIPPETLARRRLDPDDAARELVRIAARSTGVATVRHLADYFRLPVTPVAARVAELAEEGELIPVRVRGRTEQWYLHRDARLPRASRARALLSPFDSLIWERGRAEALFDLYYRIEIYVPRPKRIHGYYVLPFLLDDQIVARVDLKADRQAGALRVQAAYLEAGERIAPTRVAHELAVELAEMAAWMRLDCVEVVDSGDLAGRLAHEVAALG